jgi:hypothetical protein
MRNHWIKALALPLGAPLALSACFFAEPGQAESDAEEIIGGFPATSPRLDLVGALGFPVPGGFDVEEEGGLPAEVKARSYVHPTTEIRQGDRYVTFCSGTLIAPDVVLTAEHCVADLWGDEEFLIGFDGSHPDRAIPIIGVLAEDTIQGGAVGFGSDVAVVYLAEPVEDIALASIGTLADDDIGTDFVNIGYGIQNNNQDSGTRFLGAVTLRGILGNMADHLFGDFDNYLAHFPELGLPEELAEDLYALLELIPEYEATFGNAPGNAQSCFGDSGGPVMRATADGLTVYGVTSWGLGSLDLICDWGGAYAIFGPATLDFIDRSLACPMIPSEGMCDGTVARRCTTEDEGGYRPVETDCADIGMICGLDDDRQVTCIEDACEDVPAGGMCDGDTVVRCTNDDEGKRRVVETNCGVLGMTCGEDDAGTLTCVD